VFEHSRSPPPSWLRTPSAGTECSLSLYTFHTQPVWLYDIPDAAGSATCRVHLMPSDVFTPRRPAWSRSLHPSTAPTLSELASALHLACHISHLVVTTVRTLSLNNHHKAYTLLDLYSSFHCIFFSSKIPVYARRRARPFFQFVNMCIGYWCRDSIVLCIVHAWVTRDCAGGTCGEAVITGI
jgi:hypothetical protein